MEESSLLQKTNEKISFFRKNVSAKRIIVASFGVFLACIVMLIPYNLISNSMPSADEFMLAALVYGYYVDYPINNGVVFEQSGNFFIDAFSAVKSAVGMGWDTPLNFIVFNFIPALLLNIIGPVSTSIFSLLSQVLLIFCFFKRENRHGGKGIQTLVRIFSEQFRLVTADDVDDRYGGLGGGRDGRDRPGWSASEGSYR